jgi:lipopolysaccharide transport system ATP-binding protein
MGPNGAGKSTLLRTIAGVYEPSSGNINVNGNISSLIDISLGMDMEATGYENIRMRGIMMGMKLKQIKTIEEEIAEFTELGKFLELPIRTYSTGMNMRLAFAVATLLRPEILLMDEWLSVGDEAFRKKAEKRIEDMLETTKLLVIATHSKDLVLRRCTRVIWLEHGHVKMDGPPDEVVPHYFGK